MNGDRYVGEWNRDKPDGKGTYYYTNGDRSGLSFKIVLQTFHRFEGLLNAGNFEGKGKFFFGSLDKYEGDFSEGR